MDPRESSIWRIPLTRNQFALVDADDVERISKFNWYLSDKGYAVRNALNSDKTVKTHIHMHRIILPPPEGMEIDHINGDKLDNRKANLRIASPSQNRANTPKRKNTTSKFKGVYFDKRTRKWQARIKFENVTYNLGQHLNEEEAAVAYDDAARLLFEDFAVLNFPELGV